MKPAVLALMFASMYCGECRAQLKEETANWSRLSEAIRQILRTAEGGAL